MSSPQALKRMIRSEDPWRPHPLEIALLLIKLVLCQAFGLGSQIISSGGPVSVWNHLFSARSSLSIHSRPIFSAKLRREEKINAALWHILFASLSGHRCSICLVWPVFPLLVRHHVSLCNQSLSEPTPSDLRVLDVMESSPSTVTVCIRDTQLKLSHGFQPGLFAGSSFLVGLCWIGRKWVWCCLAAILVPFRDSLLMNEARASKREAKP